MQLAGNDPDRFSKSKAKVKVVKGCFCTFDAISRRDFRVEITFPGSTNIVAIDHKGDRHPIQASEWNNVFLCSQLRAFCAKPCYVSRVVCEFDTKETFEDFLKVAKQIYKQRVFPDVACNIKSEPGRFLWKQRVDPLKYGHSMLLWLVTNHLIEIRRTK